jgi:hypothetical protein
VQIWEVWKLRLLLLSGLALLLIDTVDGQVLGMRVPTTLVLYLGIASL